MTDAARRSEVLTDEEWRAAVERFGVEAMGGRAVVMRDAFRLLTAHDAALRSKLAERDRLLARCADYLGGKRITMTDRNVLHADIRSALEGGSRDG